MLRSPTLGLFLRFWVFVTAMLVSMGAHASATCFAVDDDTSTIVTFNQAPSVITPGVATVRFTTTIVDPLTGLTLSTERIESAYFDGATNRYYVVVQDSPNRFGFVDPVSGVLTRISPITGITPDLTGIGASATTGLTRDPTTNKWYVSRRDGRVYEMDPVLGVIVPGAFGGADFIQIRNSAGTPVGDVEDIVIDGLGRLYAVTNTPGANHFLQDINFLSGNAANQGAFSPVDLDESEGLSLDASGNIRLIIGAFGPGGTNRNFYTVDPITRATTLIYNVPSPTGVPADFEASGCNDGVPRADLRLFKTVTPSAVGPAGTALFTLVLQNEGIDPAFRVQIRDELSAGMSFVSGSIVGTCTGGCSWDNGTGIWTVGEIDIGQRRTLTLVVSMSGVATNSVAINRSQVVQSCQAATGPCVNLTDFDSTPNNKTGAWTVTEDDEAIAAVNVTLQPSVAKTFNPTSGAAGATTTLVLTLSNPNATNTAVLSAAFTDLYPPGVVNHTTPAGTTTCAAGVVSAVAGANSISLASGAVIPANGSCQLRAVVTASQTGQYTNTVAVGALTTTIGAFTNVTNAVGATAVYQVTPVNVGVIKDFVPDGVGVGGTSTLRIFFSNPTSVTASFTTAFTDNFPPGLVVASPSGVTTGCAGIGAITTTTTSITVPTTRAIAPLSQCSITVNVTAATAGTFTNSVPAGSLQTSVGNNFATSEADLIVGNPSVSKAFSPTSVQSGQTSTLVIEFFNPRSTTATFTATFVDIYPTTPQGTLVNYTTPNALDTCAGGTIPTAVAGANSVLMPIGTQIPAASSCRLTVVVWTTPTTATGTWVNTVPAGALTTTVAGVVIPSLAGATATLTVAQIVDLRVTKVASSPAVTAGQTISYTVTVSNLGPSLASTATLADVMSGVTPIGSVTAVLSGGATLAALSTATSAVNATMTLPVNSTISFAFTVTLTSFNGFVTNTAVVSPRPGQTDTPLTNNTAQVLTAINPVSLLSVAKTDAVGTVSAGGTTSYTLTFTNNGPSDASGSLVRDVPGAQLNCLSLVCNATGGAACGSMSVASLLAGHVLPSLPAGGVVTVNLICQNTVVVP